MGSRAPFDRLFIETELIFLYIHIIKRILL